MSELIETREMTADEAMAVDKLKKKFLQELKPDYINDDWLFLRFLRARDCNLDKAEEMLRNHLQWREKNDVDNIANYKPPEVAKYFPMTCIGLDKSGSPVRYLPYGMTDLKGLLKSAKQEDCIKVMMHILEGDFAKMKQNSKKTGKPITQCIYIVDFEGYTFAKATHKQTLQMLGQVMSLYEANYPERLKVGFVINASIYFTLMFAVVKPLFTGATLSKIKVYGRDGWKEDLLKYMDPEILPVSLGGTRTDPDGNPRCIATVDQGAPVPPRYYFRSTERRLRFQAGVKQLQVSRMAKVDLVLEVELPGSFLEWEFETENRDIGFGLYYKAPHAAKPTELIPQQRVEAHMACEVGAYQCEAAGTYILMFDNSYSWFQRKQVFCRANVLRPTGKKIAIMEDNVTGSIM